MRRGVWFSPPYTKLYTGSDGATRKYVIGNVKISKNAALTDHLKYLRVFLRTLFLSLKPFTVDFLRCYLRYIMKKRRFTSEILFLVYNSKLSEKAILFYLNSLIISSTVIIFAL